MGGEFRYFECADNGSGCDCSNIGISELLSFEYGRGMEQREGVWGPMGGAFFVRLVLRGFW